MIRRARHKPAPAAPAASAVLTLCLALGAGGAMAAPVALPDQEGWAAARTSTGTAQGIRLGYVELGEAPGSATGLPVILIHGYTDSSRSWSLLAGPLRDALPGRRIIAVELRGHGISDAPECCYGPDNLADDLKGAMDALGIARADLVGHSLGSITAAELAATHPDRVNRLVLASSATAIPAAASEWLWQEIPALPDQIDPADAFMTAWFANPNPVPPDFLSREMAEAAAIPKHVWTGVLTSLTTHDWTMLAPRISAPTLVLWGDQDGLFGPESQAALHAALPGADTLTYPGLGHNFFWEQPDQAAGDIAAFLKK
ncbi:alpha/beta hydrolase [Paracoccus sp. DMF-8]|uniref:alpha/beta fold hydrolase n=1 Tax=Paracoccus sp. DMF-8 TaxID=3019445 RepID=UPI0023E7B1BA|nr:alpha/beta hydrolase [Paracoccus sp. DMF-8]MDF3605388.1 alpha/beta hydrolase [Paracoccus sp. DMF-8]